MLGRLTGLPCPGLLHFTLHFYALPGLCTPGERNGEQRYLDGYPEIPFFYLEKETAHLKL